MWFVGRWKGWLGGRFRSWGGEGRKGRERVLGWGGVGRGCIYVVVGKLRGNCAFAEFFCRVLGMRDEMVWMLWKCLRRIRCTS